MLTEGVPKPCQEELVLIPACQNPEMQYWSFPIASWDLNFLICKIGA